MCCLRCSVFAPFVEGFSQRHTQRQQVAYLTIDGSIYLLCCVGANVNIAAYSEAFQPGHYKCPCVQLCNVHSRYTDASRNRPQDVRDPPSNSNFNSAQKTINAESFSSLIEKFYSKNCSHYARLLHVESIESTSTNSTTKLSSSGRAKRAEHAYAMVSKALVSAAAAVAQIVHRLRLAKSVN